jgi:CheY-like chemotaxis protein
MTGTQNDMVASRPLADMRVLVVDDHQSSADTLATLVGLELGCQVFTAYDGEQALELALSMNFDVLILDLQMPGLSGLEVASRARSSLGHINAPLLLAVTGRSDLVSELALVDVRWTTQRFLRRCEHIGRAPAPPGRLWNSGFSTP